MPKPNAKKRRVNRVKDSVSRGRTRVKGFASRGLGKKWILILLVVLLCIPAMQVAVVRFIRVKGFATRGWRRGRPRKSFASRGLIILPSGACSMCTCCRVKGFASRGCRGRTRVDVLRLPIAFREGQWVLYRLLDGFEEAVVGA